MPYITSAERIGLRRGREVGLVEGQIGTLRESLLDNLEFRFGHLPEDLRRSIEKEENVAKLKTAHRLALSSVDLPDFVARF